MIHGPRQWEPFRGSLLHEKHSGYEKVQEADAINGRATLKDELDMLHGRESSLFERVQGVTLRTINE